MINKKTKIKGLSPYRMYGSFAIWPFKKKKNLRIAQPKTLDDLPPLKHHTPEQQAAINKIKEDIIAQLMKSYTGGHKQ